MNKNIFWDKLNGLFKMSSSGELGIIGSSLAYLDENEEPIEVNYKEWGVKDFKELLSLLESLSRDNLINLIDTNNMGYFIEKK